MKTYLSLLPIFCCFTLAAQTMNSVNNSHVSIQNVITKENEEKYQAVDNYVLSMKQSFTDISELADALTDTFQLEEEKVRAIFRWMTNNISYDYDDMHSHQRQKEKIYLKNPDNVDYYYALKVLKLKKGICDGYSTLFNELCKAAGIQSEKAVGFAESNVRIVRFLRKINVAALNHAWNKVKINGHWFYIDVTWASGSGSTRGKTPRPYNPKYYLTEIDIPFDTHIEITDND